MNSDWTDYTYRVKARKVSRRLRAFWSCFTFEALATTGSGTSAAGATPARRSNATRRGDTDEVGTATDTTRANRLMVRRRRSRPTATTSSATWTAS